MKSPHAKQIFWNAMLLCAASLLMRTVGVTFQVFISNLAGAEAMGLFSLLSGVYGFALTLATSGIHLGVTHLVVDAVGRNQPDRVRPAMRRALLCAALFGTAAALLLGTFAEPIGIRFLKDARTVRSLRLLALTLPVLSLSSAMGGYFTAVRRPYKNAAVQVLEQGLKISGTMLLFASFAPQDVEHVCVLLVLGGVAAELFSFLAELALYLWDRTRRFPSREKNGRAEGRRLLTLTLPVAAASYLRSGLLTLQHVLVPEGLRRGGTAHSAALAAYGSIQSMALPIVLYPAALISSFSGLLVPELAEANVQGRSGHIRYMIARVWSLSLWFSIGTAGVLICFSQELGTLLYPNTAAADYIRILAPLVPIMYVDTATDAMLKGLGEQVFSMKINIADALISVILVTLLVPRFGIEGYLAAVYVSELFNTVCSVTHLLSVSHTRVPLLKWIYKPLFCIVIATAAVHVLLRRLPAVYGALPVFLHCLAVILLYLLLLRACGAVDREDLRWLKRLIAK